MRTLPRPGDRVMVRLAPGWEAEAALVLDTYEGTRGGMVTVQVPAEPERDDVVHTYTFSVDDVKAA